MAHIYTLMQLSEDEFDALPVSEEGVKPRAIPNYFKVDSVSGEIKIYGRLPFGKQVLALMITLENKK